MNLILGAFAAGVSGLMIHEHWYGWALNVGFIALYCIVTDAFQVALMVTIENLAKKFELVRTFPMPDFDPFPPKPVKKDEEN